MIWRAQMGLRPKLVPCSRLPFDITLSAVCRIILMFGLTAEIEDSGWAPFLESDRPSIQIKSLPPPTRDRDGQEVDGLAGGVNAPGTNASKIGDLARWPYLSKCVALHAGKPGFATAGGTLATTGADSKAALQTFPIRLPSGWDGSARPPNPTHSASPNASNHFSGPAQESRPPRPSRA